MAARAIHERKETRWRMFYKKNNSGYKTLSGGIQYKTLVHGFDTSMHEFKIEKGSIIPVHSHPHEQTGYLVAGRLIFVFKDKTMGAESGDSWNIPGGEAHGVQAIEDCVVIEVFSPTRKEYLS